MFVVKDQARIRAPLERVFLLSTELALVRQILGMSPVGGSRTSGRVLAGDTVEWRGWKFGLPQNHTSLISAYQAPVFFQDTQLRGRFATFQHDHHFTEDKGEVLLEDEVRFALPFGPPGALIARTIMLPHIAGLLRQRFALLKRTAESEDWRRWLN